MQVVFEITTDAKLLAQYYELREKSYRKTLKLDNFCGREEELDRQSDIMIARIGDECLGGVRICGADNQELIPLEHSSESLEKQLPDLDLDQNSYCQWMRLSLSLSRDLKIPHLELQKQFCFALTKFSIKLGYRYGFCLSSKIHHRYYKRIFTQYGYNYWKCDDVSIELEEEFDDLEHLLCVTDMYSIESDDINIPHTEFNVTYHLNI